MITVADLKENKEAIIEMVALKDSASRTKELMSLMVDSIGFRGYDGMNALQFAAAVIKDNPSKLEISDNSDYYIEQSKLQMGSSMRKY